MSQTKTNNKNPNILITGGAGFLGQRIVEEFLSNDSPLVPGIVRVFDNRHYGGKFEDRIEIVKGDIRNPGEVGKACKGIDIVIHSAAIIDWGTRSENEVLDVNVGGTENVIRACKENGIKNLVYTSSLDAVFTGKPYPFGHRHLA